MKSSESLTWRRQGLSQLPCRVLKQMLIIFSSSCLLLSDEINLSCLVRQASLCTFVSFLTRYFLLIPPAQDIHAYDMIGRIIAVSIHFIMDGFTYHVLPTICLHCINAVVALRVIRVISGFQVSLLSRVTPNSLASLESSSFEPFIDKKPKSGFRLWVNRTISVFLLLNCSSCSEAQFAAIFIAFWAIPLIQSISAPVTNTARSSA